MLTRRLNSYRVFSRTTPFSKRAMYSFWQNRNLGVALVNTVITAISQRAVYVGGLLKKVYENTKPLAQFPTGTKNVQRL